MDLESLLQTLHSQIAEESALSTPSSTLLAALRAEGGESTAALIAAACGAKDAAHRVAAADAARETTFGHIGALEASDDGGGAATITLRYRAAWLGAYSLASIVWADAQLAVALAARASESAAAGATTAVGADVAAAARGALRAVDLALLRGGSQWNTVAHGTITRATAAAAAIDAEAAASAESSPPSAKRARVAASTSAASALPMPTRAELKSATPLWLRGESAPHVVRIARIAAASLTVEAFCEQYLRSATPVIVTGAMAAWPAMGASAAASERREDERAAGEGDISGSGSSAARVRGGSRAWSDVGYLRKLAGERLVPVETCAAADQTQTYLTSSWSQEVVRLGDFIDDCVAAEDVVDSPETAAGAGAGTGGEAYSGGTAATASRSPPPRRGYLAQHQLFAQIPQLRADLGTPFLCKALLPTDTAPSASNATRVNAWFGPRGTVSPLHYDPFHNSLCQVVGYKYIRLVDAQHSERLYRREPPRHNNCYIDLDTAHVSERERERACVNEMCSSPNVGSLLLPGPLPCLFPPHPPSSPLPPPPPSSTHTNTLLAHSSTRAVASGRCSKMYPCGIASLVRERCCLSRAIAGTTSGVSLFPSRLPSGGEGRKIWWLLLRLND